MAVLLHPVHQGVRIPPVAFSTEYEARTLAQDREIVDRIIAAYHAALASARAETRQAMFGTVWGAGGFGGRQGDLVRALEDRSAERTHGILKRFFVSDAAHGIAIGREEADYVKASPDHARQSGLIWLDRLVGLAFATGALPLINPEDNSAGWERALDVDVDTIRAAIERVTGVPLVFPDVMGVLGAPLGGRPFPTIAFTHLLVALSIRTWLQALAGGHAVEIGGGFGDLAYWTTRLHACRYTVYDLPFANAAQAYFLWRAIPGVSLRLAGEPAGAGDKEIALLPGWLLLEDPPASADVVVNQDSLVEIPRAIARGYLASLRGFLQGPFLSVNHESWQRLADALDRTSVADSIGVVGGYTRLSRGPFPLRLGYVQEVYLPTGPATPAGGPGRNETSLLQRLGRLLRGARS